MRIELVFFFFTKPRRPNKKQQQKQTKKVPKNKPPKEHPKQSLEPSKALNKSKYISDEENLNKSGRKHIYLENSGQAIIRHQICKSTI